MLIFAFALSVKLIWSAFCNAITLLRHLLFAIYSKDTNEDVYRMNHAKRGVFVLINNKTFRQSTKLKERKGTDVDAANLYEVFMGLGFDVRLESNKTTVEMMMILRKGKGD